MCSGGARWTGRAGLRGAGSSLLALTVGLFGLSAIAFAGSAAAAPTTVAFTTQGCTTWMVPTDVSSVQIQATGAAGGGAGGLGDGVSGTLSGLAGGTQVLDVCVDQGGGPGGAAFIAPGGNGGGASGVSLGSDFSSPMLVAGGGGGQGGGSGGAGGSAGTPVAGSGGNTSGIGGGGGDNTTAMGGAAGTDPANSLCNGGGGGQFGPAGPGSGGAGGAGVCGNGGGGGGAGYFGGGGGASAGGPGNGGGGGTDFCAAAVAGCTVSSGAGTQTMAGSGTGDAQVTITYAFTSTSVSAPASGTPGTAIAAGSISATLSGATSAATGTITFTVFGPQSSPPTDCTSGGTTVGTAAVSGNGTYNPSAGFTPPSVGTYWWYASYSGDDGANQPSNSSCGTGMTSTVVKDATSAGVSAPASGTAGTAIAAGSISATLSGATSAASGTITFTVFGPQASPPTDCTSGGTTVGTAAVSGNGTYNPSAGFTPPSAGTYWWYASYSGDDANQPSDSGCGTGMTATLVSAAPTATTGPAINVTQTGATLTGAINPNDSATTYYFQYGTSTAYGSDTPSQNAGSDTATHNESTSISGLSPGTTYHFRIVAQNSVGAADGADRTFTTQAATLPPLTPPTLQPLKLSVSPRHARAGTRACFAFKASSNRHPVAGATVRFANHTARTSHAGKARICLRLHQGTYHPSATKAGYRSARATVRASAATKPRPKPTFTG